MERALSFKDYLKECKPKKDFARDFVGDALFDEKFPSIRSWKQLEDYLYSRQACCAALEGAQTVWKAYRVRLRQNANEGLK